MRLEDLGEFGLIDRIEKLFLPGASDVLQGIGDDCAVLDQGDHCLLRTTDALVEGVHFRLAWTSPKALGRKSIAVNVSDIVAMGGTPQYALLSLGIPPATSVHFLEEFLAGVREMSDLCGVTLVGGDTPAFPVGTLIGQAVLATAMIDVSDGLSQGLGHVCTLSGVGAILVESLIPI